MKDINFRRLLPHVLAILFFLLLSVSYFPDQIQGKVIKQHDVSTYRGMAQEVDHFKKETGETSLWTNSMFGGMPTYLIKVPGRSKVFFEISRWLQLDYYVPLSHLFLYMLGFYLALLAFRINPWLAVAGAVAYAFSSYFFIIISAGHLTKAIALGYMPAVIGGVYLAFDRKPIIGTIMLTFFLALEILTNHLQIVYYSFLIILIFGIFWFVKAIREQTVAKFIKTGLILLVGVVFAIGVNATVLYMSYDYGKDSLRGASELSNNQHKKTSGLDKDYATAWSYGKMETFTFLIPNFKGGASSGSLGVNSEVYKLYEKSQGKATAKKAIKQQPLYWGDQPGTSGPVYIGAVVCFLFILGLFVVKGAVKWWLLAATIFSILLGWGHNFMPLTDLFLDYFPGYNKFRTVSMILVMAEFTMPLLAILAISKVIEGDISKKDFKQGLYWALGITGGLSLVFALFAGSFSYAARIDENYLAQGAGVVVDALRADRQMLLRNDAFRSLFFILLAGALSWAAFEKKIDKKYIYPMLILLFLVDLWPINKRYLNSDNFVNARRAKQDFTPTKADQYILGDKDPDFRVLNLTVSTFNDASTSYFHKSIGGYHGAKMHRYQDLIDFHVSKEIQSTITALQDKTGAVDIFNELGKQTVLNMLNTKYLILNPEGRPLQNPAALGNAWFVSSIQMVDNADQEIASLNNLNAANKAIVDKKFASMLDSFTPVKDSTASIVLNEYRPNYLKYTAKTSSQQLAVFSEVYYEKGWNAYIDGAKVDHFRVDYILRSMIIPEGEHLIEFKFQPKSYRISVLISNIVSILFILTILGLMVRPILNIIDKDKKA